MEVERGKKPALARGCRLRDVCGQSASIQIPEGMIKMTGAGLEIIKLCDGQATVEDILATLKSRYPESFHSRVEKETLEFLTRLKQRLILSFL